MRRQRWCRDDAPARAVYVCPENLRLVPYQTIASADASQEPANLHAAIKIICAREGIMKYGILQSFA